ncbi:septal ring lytic transglycosylase RlpA family protein [Hyphococcus flavus]|uniref:Endolytic peptidoglycan transglycosylase RlpA n=1 Tax=Hyphococcus flavus TaxID=1866326 RepID=A0AAE9ZDP7_9PROT|nr:septal ring lytic transglycosylase RlpA family protein [Hyphococcus flavus]WDI31057.1 septal ring lytic transglycosylase RlpA family protein [Hyphococcus flavus]
MSKPFRLLLALFTLVAVAGCATQRTASPGDASPHYKIGKPYKVNGRWYHPKEDPNYVETGVASWYGAQFHGRLTANGEIFDMNRLSAAHTTLPLPSMVEVTNLENGRSITVRVNDRGPFAHNRIIDMSREAARKLDFEQQGTTRVRVRYAGPAPLMARAAPSDRSRPPQEEPIDRVARAAEVKEPSDTSGPPAAPETDEISELLTSIESAPALTPGAEASSIAEACSPAEGACQIPAADLSTPDPDDARLIDPKSSPAAAPQALYIIRVAALTNLDHIDRLRTELGDVGTLRLSRVETEAGAVFYRVNLGPFSSIETAAQRLEAVRKAGYGDAALVTLTP